MAHNHGGHCCGEEDHSHDDTELGIQYSLYKHIDTENVECLNETVDGSGKTIFKPWEDRLNKEKVSKFHKCVLYIIRNNNHYNKWYLFRSHINGKLLQKELSQMSSDQSYNEVRSFI
jgi:hypothetical protein